MIKDHVLIFLLTLLLISPVQAATYENKNVTLSMKEYIALIQEAETDYYNYTYNYFDPANLTAANTELQKLLAESQSSLAYYKSAYELERNRTKKKEPVIIYCYNATTCTDIKTQLESEVYYVVEVSNTTIIYNTTNELKLPEDLLALPSNTAILGGMLLEQRRESYNNTQEILKTISKTEERDLERYTPSDLVKIFILTIILSLSALYIRYKQKKGHI